MREHLQQPLTGLAESIALAAAGQGRIVLVDAADATSSGAPGDSNAILRAMLESGYRRTALIPIVDAPAVEAATAPDESRGRLEEALSDLEAVKSRLDALLKGR